MKYRPRSTEEAEYLKNFDPSKYPKPAVAADIALFAYDATECSIKLLLVKRGGFPYRGDWAFPGGFVNMDETVDTAARRELLEETGVKDVYLEPLEVFSDPDRDPRERVITVAYLAFANLKKLNPKAGDDAKEAEWFAVSESIAHTAETEAYIERTVEITLAGPVTMCPVVRERTSRSGIKRTEYEILYRDGMAFEHGMGVMIAYRRLLERLRHSDIARNALSETFDPGQLEALYKTAFREKYEEAYQAVKKRIETTDRIHCRFTV